MKTNQPKFHAAALALLVCACGAPDKHAESPFAPAPDPNAPMPTHLSVAKPWTDQFMTAAVLVARDVRIEGPDGLLEHVVARQELEIVDVVTKTTPDGLLQTITVKQAGTGVEIRAQLDNLAIASLHSLTILERPGPVDVLVVAEGDAFYQEKGSKTEQRAPTLRFAGKVAR